MVQKYRKWHIKFKNGTVIFNLYKEQAAVKITNTKKQVVRKSTIVIVFVNPLLTCLGNKFIFWIIIKIS